MRRAVALLAVLAFATPAAAAPRVRRVAVYDFQGNDVSSRTCAVFTDALVGELRKLDGLSILGLNEVRAMLTHEMNRQLAGCDTDSCVAELAGALGVDEIVVGSLGRVGDSHVLDVKRLDVASARVARSEVKRVPVVDGQEFLSLVGPVTETLYPDVPLKAGFLRGVNPELVNILKPPPLPKWAFLATGAAGLLLAGTGGGFYFSALGTRDEVVRLENAQVDTSLTLPLRAEVEQQSFRANAFLLTGALVLAAAGVEALFTDWYGYRDWKPGAPVEAPR